MNKTSNSVFICSRSILSILFVAAFFINVNATLKKVISYPSDLMNKELRDSNTYDQRTISGTVTFKPDDSPLSGVSVVVQGTTTGVQTDFDGKYSIEASEGDTLVFSYVGMVTQNIVVGSSNVIDVIMSEDVSALDEVVVTALGIKKSKKALAFAVTEVNGDDVSKAKVVNLGTALTGKVAGVQVTTPASGASGSSRVIIRGNSSLSGNNQPLYVVDGVPINNNNYGSAGQWGGSDKGDGISSINPDDIETMSVLKGANASALYGSRGVNGVILITTKSGRGAKGIGVEFNSTATFDNIVSDQEHQKIYGQGIEGRKYTSQQELLGTNDGGLQSWGAKLDGSSVVQFDGVSRPYSYTGNKQKQFYVTGSTFTNTLTLTGGDEKTNWRFSVGDMSNDAVMPNSSMKRNNYTIRIGSQLSKKFRAEMSGTYIRQRIHNAIRVSDFPHNANTGIANVPANVSVDAMKGPTGKLGAGEDGRELNVHGTIWWGNPYWAAYQDERKDAKERLMGNVTFRYNITDWLYAQGRMGIDSQILEQEERTAYGDLIDGGRGSISHNTNRFLEENIEGVIGANKDITEDFSASLLLGGNKMTQKNTSKGVSGNTFDIPFWEVYENTQNRGAGKGFNSQQINSLFYSAEVSYKDLLFVTATGRNDWFSTLNGRDQFYPSFGLSAIVSDMVKLPDNIDFLKLSSSLGKSSGATGPYQLNSSYSLGNPFNGFSVGGVAQGTIPNANLTPLLTSEFEIGMDLRMFKSRFGIDITYYNKKTTDDILNAQVSLASGFGAKVVNIGEMSNRGIELLVYGTPIRNKDFEWETSLNLGYNKNEVVSLLDPENDEEVMDVEQSRHLHAFIKHYEGLPYSQVSGYKYLKDSNGDLVLNASGLPQRDDELGIVPFGTGNAPYNGGFTNMFRYKNLSLSFLVDFRFGGVMHSGSNARAYQYGLHKNTLVGRETGIGSVPAEDIVNYYKAIADNITEEFVYKSDFVKLREIVLAYPIPQTIVDKLRVHKIDVSLVGRNLLTLYKDVPNVDPESGYNAGNGQGLEFFPVPRIRSYGLNLNVKF